MYPKNRTKRIATWLILTVVLLGSQACSVLSPPEPTPTDTPEPTSTPEPTPTNTPEPTATTVPTETPDTAATQSARSTEAAEALIAESVVPVLEEVGISPDRGHLAWQLDSPITLTVSDFNTERFESIADGEEYGDFVVYVKVQWDSEGALAYCGVKFRSDRDLFDGDRYEFFVTRFSGLPWWDVAYIKDGFVESYLTGSTLQTSRNINQESNSINEYVIVVDGTVATSYVNNTRLGTVTISNLHDGELGVLTYQESGRTTCEYQEIWLWSLDE